MTPPDGGRGPRRAPVAAPLGAAALVALAGLVAFLRPLALSFPTADLDGGWTAVLGEAARVPARWGVDLVFTYGPASALVTRYFTPGYLRFALPLAAASAVLFGLVVARTAALSMAGRRHGTAAVALAAAGTALALVGAAWQIPDPFYFAFAFAAFLLDLRRRRGDAASAALVAASALALGALALSKSGYGILAATLFLVGDARALLATRRPPWSFAALACGFVLAYVGFGQRLGDLPVYLRLQGEVAAGYGEAMYSVGSRAELVGFLAAAASLLAATAAYALRSFDRARCAAAVGGTALALLVALKAGFIRQDEHTQIAWTFLGFACAGVAVAVVLPRSRAAAAALGTAGLAAVWIAASLAAAADDAGTTARRGPAAALAASADVVGAEAQAWRDLLADPAAFLAQASQAKTEAWSAIRAAHPLPPLSGTVDILPSAQTWVLAARLDYHPRPSFQDYSTYTAGLIAANVAFYAGGAAPDWTIFGADGLDDRYPAMSEGALWPLLVARYEPTLRAGDFVALRRRPVPLPDVLGSASRRDARLGESFAVPPGPTFAHIAVRKTLLGRLAAALFRPPALRLSVTLATGETRDFRFIPALGEGGFLISPLVETADQFALLAIGQGGDLAARDVASARIAGSPAARWFYAPDIAIAFAPVDVPAAAPSPAARPLFDALSLRHGWRALATRIGGARSFDGDRLSAPAPDTLSVPSAGWRRIRLGFGIEDGAWTAGHTEGVCFALRIPGDDAAPLWRRCLDPAHVAADRGPQSAEVDLPAGASAVTLATACRRSCDWGWSYWNEVAPGG